MDARTDFLSVYPDSLLVLVALEMAAATAPPTALMASADGTPILAALRAVRKSPDLPALFAGQLAKVAVGVDRHRGADQRASGRR